MNPQVCLFVCYSGLCAHYCINPSFPSLVAQWRGGGKIEICNYPSVYGCDMQLYCFWFAVVVGYSGVPPRRQCFWLIGMLEKDGCQRLCVLFEALLFEVFPFVDKSNQEGHRNILAKCLASCLTKEKKKCSQTEHFSLYVLEMSLAQPNSANCVFLVDHRGNDSLIRRSRKPKEIKWNDSQSPVIPVPFCSRLCNMLQRTT